MNCLEHRARTPLSVLKMEVAELKLDTSTSELLHRQLEKLVGIFQCYQPDSTDISTFFECLARGESDSWMLKTFARNVRDIIGTFEVGQADSEKIVYRRQEKVELQDLKFESFTEYLIATHRPPDMDTIVLDFAIREAALKLKLECKGDAGLTIALERRIK